MFKLSDIEGDRDTQLKLCLICQIQPVYKSVAPVELMMGGEKHKWSKRLFSDKSSNHLDQMKSQMTLQALLSTCHRFRKILGSLQVQMIAEVEENDESVVHIEYDPVHMEDDPVKIEDDEPIHIEDALDDVEQIEEPVEAVEDSEDDMDDMVVTKQVLSKEARKNCPVATEPQEQESSTYVADKEQHNTVSSLGIWFLYF